MYTPPAPFTYKDLLLKKLYYSVISSVVSQLVLLLLYILASNIDITRPQQWITTTLEIFTYFNTWLCLIPFVILILAQSIICAKDYVSKSHYCSTRFQRFVSAFSMHNLVLLVLHLLSGPTLTWLFLTLSGGRYQSLTKQETNKTYVLNQGSFYLIINGAWIGFYYFFKGYLTEKHLSFPTVHQRKWLQFKSQLFNTFKQSFVLSALPSVYFIIIYLLWGQNLYTTTRNLFGLLPDTNNFDITVYIHLWCFNSLFYFNMNLMKFFFNVFLTEPVEFPLEKVSSDVLNLQECLVLSDLPIIQNLACLDFCTLAEWSPERRKVLFSLSQPGGHPHNWNLLVEQVLKLFKHYTDLLNKSTDTKDVVEVETTPEIIKPVEKFKNLRNMSLKTDPSLLDIVDVTHSNLPGSDFTETVLNKVKLKLSQFLQLARFLLCIDFIFGEVPQANVQKCLANGSVIVWTCRGVSDLVCAALVEDRYGVVQKDIPGIVTSIVRLKQSLDKLNKVSALTKKVAGYDDFNYKMKGALGNSVKRCLFRICVTYKGFLGDFPLSKDVQAYLNGVCKS